MQHSDVKEDEAMGAYTIKRIVVEKSLLNGDGLSLKEKISLVPENPAFAPIQLPNEGEFGKDYRVVGVFRQTL